jgi:hypothetical protein
LDLAVGSKGLRPYAPDGRYPVKRYFIYRNHDEMEADRVRWTVEAMIERARNG